MTGIALRLCAALAWLLAAAAPVHADEARGGGRPWRITMVTWSGWTDTEQAFEDYFATHRIPVDLRVLDAGSRPERLRDIVHAIKADPPDLVYGWGTYVALNLFGPYDKADPRQHITDIPSIFVQVSQPVEIGLVPSLASSGRNLAGSTYLAPLEAQIRTMQTYLPFDRLAVVYSARDDSAVEQVGQLRRLAGKAGFTLAEFPLGSRTVEPSPAEIPAAVAAAAAERPGFLYIPPGSFQTNHRAELTAEALRHRLPAFAAAEGALQGSDALAGLVARYYNIGQLAATQAEAILVRGVDPRDMPIASLSRFSFILNMRVARALELYPPMSLLRIAEIAEEDAK